VNWWRRKRDLAAALADHGDDLVEVARIGEIEAELIAARIRGAGIDAVVFRTGAGSSQPTLTYAEGARVMVRRRDAEAAAALVEPEPEP
jgi:hypothetical protein